MLPVDHHTAFHKTCGVATFALAALHTAMHLANIALNLAQDNYGAFAQENGMEVRAVQFLLSKGASTYDVLIGNGFSQWRLHEFTYSKNSTECKRFKKM